MEILEAAEAEVPELINRDETKKSKILINSHAGGMAVARPYGFEIDFVGNPLSVSRAWFFVFIFKFILTLIFEIKIYEINSLTSK